MEAPFQREFSQALDPLTAANRLRVQPGVHVVALDGSGNATIAGNTTVGGYTDMAEIAAPVVPAADTARLYVRDNGAGKTQLVVQFPTGAVQVIATEP